MIIFISGSINSGKSTVSKLLAEKIPRSALLEVDQFHDFIEWMPIEEAIPLNLENAISVIENFTKRGLDVIVPYPLSQKNYGMFVKTLEPLRQKIFVFTLNLPLEIALSNRGGRELTEWEKERIKHHYEIGINHPNFGTVIDTFGQTPSEIVTTILHTLKISINSL